MQVGDLVRYTDYDMKHKKGVKVTGILISLGKSRWGEPLWRVKHMPPFPFTHKGTWQLPKNLEIISASR